MSDVDWTSFVRLGRDVLRDVTAERAVAASPAGKQLLARLLVSVMQAFVATKQPPLARRIDDDVPHDQLDWLVAIVDRALGRRGRIEDVLFDRRTRGRVVRALRAQLPEIALAVLELVDELVVRSKLARARSAEA